MGFDGFLVNGCVDLDCVVEEVVELINGCICCMVVDDFLLIMEMFLVWEILLEYIVIEIFGLVLL